MTDSLTETGTAERAGGLSATIAPPAEPGVDEPEPQVGEPIPDGEGEGVDDGSAAAGIGIEREPTADSFGARIGRWFRNLGNRIVAAQPESFISLLVVGFCVLF